ncbi:DRC5, partial [Symbiodinium sp. KB8]
ASEDYVFTLYLERLLSHIDMELVFRHLPNLTSLHLTYRYAALAQGHHISPPSLLRFLVVSFLASVKKIGMKYDRSLFGMKISDAMSLAKCIKATDTLTSLA